MILITGASGNVGGEVLKQAAAAKLKIRATYQSPDKAKGAPAGVEAVLMDYTKPETIRAAVNGIEKVFLVGPPAPNVADLEGRFVKEAKRSGLKHIVKLSALGGREAIFPGLHRDSEGKIEASGIAYTFLRPNGFMQNLINYNSGTINGQNAFYAAQGDGAVSHIDIRDIAAAAVKVLSSDGHEGKACSLTGPEALTNAQIGEKLSRALGRTIRYVDVPAGELRKSLLSAGVPEWSADALLDLQRLYREGGASLVDPTVERITGRKARSFDEFARDYSSAFRQDARVAS
jgi:uncharacterized protein YbjT (DUF2867 family)